MIDIILQGGHFDKQYSFFYKVSFLQIVLWDGVNLMGYTPWGCIDCVSFTTGEMEKRYGMIYVDRDNQGNGTLERKRKKPFYWYKKVISSNGQEL